MTSIHHPHRFHVTTCICTEMWSTVIHMITHMITRMITHTTITIIITTTRTCRWTPSSRRRPSRWSQPQNPQPTASSSWDLQVDCVKFLYDHRGRQHTTSYITSPPYVNKTNKLYTYVDNLTWKHRMLLVLLNVWYNICHRVFDFCFTYFYENISTLCIN